MTEPDMLAPVRAALVSLWQEGAPAPNAASEARPVVQIHEAAFGELVAGRVARLGKPDGGEIEVTLAVSWDRVLETIVRAIEARARRV